MLYFFKIYSRNVGKRCRSLLVKLIKQAFIKIYICILIFTSILGGLLSIFVFVFKFLSVFWGAYKAEPHQIWPLSARPRPAFAAIIPFMAFFRQQRGWFSSTTKKRQLETSEIGPIWVFSSDAAIWCHSLLLALDTSSGAIW